MARPELKTQKGYDFYEVASALQKSIRRGQFRVAGFFALELFPQYANYCWKRLLTISAEDCYGIITQEIKALHESFLFVNKGKTGAKLGGRVFISKAVLLLCLVKHNRDADILSNYIYDQMNGITDEDIDKCLEEVRKEPMEIPEYVYDVHTLRGKRMGKTKQDFFKEEEAGLANKQPSLFEGIEF